MSSGQKPRTPEHFPLMKVRGARRRRLAPWQRIAGYMGRSAQAVSAALDPLLYALDLKKDNRND